LLFTNDGVLSDSLASPASHVHKVYRVQLDHLPSTEDIRRLETGIPILDEVTLPAKIEIETSALAPALNENPIDAAGVWIRITIREGKNRQVRRMLAAVGCEVRRLIRIRFGPLELGELPVGQWRYLSEREVQALRRAIIPQPDGRSQTGA
jgi:23S rRNA pseudouridine2605 synthase